MATRLSVAATIRVVDGAKDRHRPESAWENLSVSRKRGWFRHLPRWIRWTAPAMVLSGLGLAVLGFIGDSNGWWTDYPVTSNIGSTLTGALVGIPISALLISEIVEDVRLSRVRGQVKDTISQMLRGIAMVITELVDTDLEPGGTPTERLRDLSVVTVARRSGADGEPDERVTDAHERVTSGAPSREEMLIGLQEISWRWHLFRNALREWEFHGLPPSDDSPLEEFERAQERFGKSVISRRQDEDDPIDRCVAAGDLYRSFLFLQASLDRGKQLPGR